MSNHPSVLEDSTGCTVRHYFHVSYLYLCLNNKASGLGLHSGSIKEQKWCLMRPFWAQVSVVIWMRTLIEGFSLLFGLITTEEKESLDVSWRFDKHYSIENENIWFCRGTEVGIKTHLDEHCCRILFAQGKWSAWKCLEKEGLNNNSCTNNLLGKKQQRF